MHIRSQVQIERLQSTDADYVVIDYAVEKVGLNRIIAVGHSIEEAVREAEGVRPDITGWLREGPLLVAREWRPS